MDNPSVNTKLYAQIAELLYAAKKRVVRAVNETIVITYFEIGRMIVEEEQNGEERAAYGKELIPELSRLLTKEFGKGFSATNLRQMRTFYLAYQKQQTVSDESDMVIRQTVSDELESTSKNITQNQISEIPSQKLNADKPQTFWGNFNLSWSHYLMLMRIENIEERKFYEIECAKNNWSVRELQRQIDTELYTRLTLSRDKNKVKELSEKGLIFEQPKDAIKDPYILEFLGLPELTSYSETELEEQIISKLEHFLLELGNGFTFVGRQVRFTFDEEHFRIDLVFYNRILRCFVLIDLKIGKLKHQDLGQMQMYVNYYDRFVKLEDENNTIGIILCKDKKDTMVEITLPENNNQIFASKYKLVLPSKDELKKIME
jgi:predicted nuclease of restriction endonuclease-like (RecB) superfamily